jgi:ribosome biogenesis protein BMS1
MRTVGQIRRENQVPIELNKDSLYKKIVRVPREFRKLAIPKKLQEELPFKSKPKVMDKKRASTYIARRAVIVEPEDRRKRAAVQILSTIGADKISKRHQAQVRRTAAKSAEQKRTVQKFEDMSREARKRAYRDIGKEKTAKKVRHS